MVGTLQKSDIINQSTRRKESPAMKNRAFSKLLEQLKILTPFQKEKLQSSLAYHNAMDTISDEIDTPQKCPYHSSESHQKWGICSGLQRYRCNSCEMTYTALTGTPLARLGHRNPKSFGARHLHGIVEFDEIYFIESHKREENLDQEYRKRGDNAVKIGVSSEQTAVLVARDRKANTMDTILFKSNQETLAEVMLTIVDRDDLLCSDKKTSYRAFAKKYHLTLKTINTSAKEYVKGKIYHIQNVNAYDSRLKCWMKQFSVVATKYLESYLGWMRLLDKEKNFTPT